MNCIQTRRFEIRLSPEQKPRQGVNTCGANSVFIFDNKPLHLPEQFLYPLATKEIWATKHIFTLQVDSVAVRFAKGKTAHMASD